MEKNKFQLRGCSCRHPFGIYIFTKIFTTRQLRKFRNGSKISGMHCNVQYRGGFTATELVVIVGIVAVLIALAFPVFQRMTRSGADAKCVGNLRQIGAAFALYVAEAGKYPPVRLTSSNSDNPWSSYLDAILNWGRWGNKSEIGICPNAERKDVISYGYNACFPYTTFWSAAKVQTPSKLMLVADTSYNIWRIAPASYKTDMAFRHAGSANILYADGHVGRKPVDGIPSAGRYANDADWNSFWGIEFFQ